MRVLVCGDRNWVWADRLRAVLDSFPFDTLIVGGARGTDRMAAHWAEFHNLEIHNLEVEVYPANWEKYGKAAGPIRNAQMLKKGKPDLVVAFHDYIEESSGTANMLCQAEDAGVPYCLIEGVI